MKNYEGLVVLTLSELKNLLRTYVDVCAPSPDAAKVLRERTVAAIEDGKSCVYALVKEILTDVASQESEP